MLDEQDIEQMQLALSKLSRAELEVFCLDRTIRTEVFCRIMTEPQIKYATIELNDLPLSAEDKEEMSRLMSVTAAMVGVGY